MAAQDEFHARIVGRGGHAALPHRTLDPVVAAAHGVIALQAVVARSVDPLRAAVVSVGSFHAGTAPNIIPDDARLEGTLRSFDPEIRTLLRERVRETLEGCAHASRCALELDLRPGYPAVVNASGAVERVRRAAARVFGPPNVIDTEPLAAAEDFAYFLERVPGAFVLVGAGNEARGITAPHHSPAFDIDESVLPRGVELLARLALDSAALSS
jgi:amidohydrolase